MSFSVEAGGQVRKPTITTVAKRAGVAESTVSRYLNGRYVSKSVRARLAKIIEELGYSRSLVARNLSIGKNGCIGVVVDSGLDLWFAQLLAGIEGELTASNASLMLASLELRGRYDPSIVLGWIRERCVDGLIIAKSRKRERPLLHAAADAKLPTVLVAPDEAVAQLQVVRCDNHAAGMVVANHLADLGHTRIAFAGGPEHSLDSKHRLHGLRAGLANRGIQLEPEWTWFCGSYDAGAGVEFARRFLEARPQVTALVLGNDALALGFMRMARQHGVAIPEDLSIVGFDNVPEAALVWPGLTTMAQPMCEMGETACRRLFEQIKTRDEARVIEYPMELIVRESSGPAQLASRAHSGPNQQVGSVSLLDGRSF